MSSKNAPQQPLTKDASQQTSTTYASRVGVNQPNDEAVVYYLTEKKKWLKNTRDKFIHDLDHAFFFGERYYGPENFRDIFQKYSDIRICNLKEKFQTLPLRRIKMELENVIKKIGFLYRVSYKQWICECQGRGGRHYFPERVCMYCGVGIRLYDTNFGTTFVRE